MWRPFLLSLQGVSLGVSKCESVCGRGGDVRFFRLFDAFLDLLNDPYDTDDSPNEETCKLSRLNQPFPVAPI